jgi:hypothetical protein
MEEACGVRIPNSQDGYCPCAEKGEHEYHRCVHGAVWKNADA